MIDLCIQAPWNRVTKALKGPLDFVHFDVPSVTQCFVQKNFRGYFTPRAYTSRTRPCHIRTALVDPGVFGRTRTSQSQIMTRVVTSCLSPLAPFRVDRRRQMEQYRGHQAAYRYGRGVEGGATACVLSGVRAVRSGSAQGLQGRWRHGRLRTSSGHAA